MDEFEEKKKDYLAHIYFEAGAALFDCQSFEYGIGYLLYLLSCLGTNDLDSEHLTAILDGEEKKTAGQLINMLKKYVRISNNIAKGLEDALKARNKMVHRFLVENVERFIDLNEHEKIVAEIRSLRSTIRRSHNQLKPFVEHLADSTHGINIAEMNIQVKEQIMRNIEEHSTDKNAL